MLAQSISQMPMSAFLFPLYVYPLNILLLVHQPFHAPDPVPFCSCSLLCSSPCFLCKQPRRCPVPCLCPWSGPAGSGSRNQNQPRAAPARSSADLAAIVGLKTLLWGNFQAVIHSAKRQKGHASRFRALILEKKVISCPSNLIFPVDGAWLSFPTSPAPARRRNIEFQQRVTPTML